MVIFKDNSLINYEVLKALLNHALMKWSLDVISEINTKRKKIWMCKYFGIINNKEHNRILNSWCSKTVTKLVGYAKIGDEVGRL